MTEYQPLSSKNKTYGFWKECTGLKIPVRKSWRVASRFLTEQYGLTPIEAREFLDRKTGKWLAAELANRVDVKDRSEEGMRAALEKVPDQTGNIHEILIVLGTDRPIQRAQPKPTL